MLLKQIIRSSSVLGVVAAILFLVTFKHLVSNRMTIQREVFSDMRKIPQLDIEKPAQSLVPEIAPKCELKEKGECYAQCCEDHRLFERFFSNPIVCNGTYVEIGAINGLELTNTKFFEDSLGWSGVLIEGDPDQSRFLKKNRPKSIIREMAICKEGQDKVNFTVNTTAYGGVVENIPQANKRRWQINTRNVVQVPCMPMGKLLHEAGITHIDLFSLDVEGSEMIVLETMDWTIPVKYFIVETQGGHAWVMSLRNFFAKKGFRAVPRKKDEGCLWNTVFENEKLVKT